AVLACIPMSRLMAALVWPALVSRTWHNVSPVMGERAGRPDAAKAESGTPSLARSVRVSAERLEDMGTIAA
ncbi:MAG TPA: hypothetical protein PK812_12095, partial [Beijerinckiaceae bacterium]|nr:hypothetical protein [Beijerinckiaceae bacterium]